ncbi:response regulator [Paenibacillus sp. TRM 82003]|nr:response regulator [Paenibacillus sp. TRM 82003]
MYSFIIVDDEPLIRRGLLKKIESYGTPLTFLGEADNGEDALALIQRVKPDILFTDMRMPVLDGKSLLRTLQKEHPEIKIVVTSGYSDFEYMQEAISAKVINYLLKPFNRQEIHSALDKVIAHLQTERAILQEARHQSLEKERLGREADVKSLLNVIMGIHPKHKSVTLLSGAYQPLSDARTLILMIIYKTRAIETEFPSLPNTFLFPHPQNDQLTIAVTGYPEALGNGEVQERSKKIAERFLDAMRSVGNHGCVGISGVKSSIDALHQAHWEATGALNRRSLTDFGHYYEYRPDHPDDTNVIWERTDELLFFIESGQPKKVEELVVDYFAFYLRQPSVKVYHIKDQCRLIFQEVKKVLYDYLKAQLDDTRSSSLESVLNTSFDLEAIRKHFLTVLTELALLLQDNPTYGSDNVIDNVKTYIGKNFRSDLSLEKVSSLFFMNPSYLSHLFKEKTGENFTDFINSLRIEHAKQLLKSTDEKIYKVAKQLGYDNSKYFFRVFKKLTGLTPDEYRKQA